MFWWYEQGQKRELGAGGWLDGWRAFSLLRFSELLKEEEWLKMLTKVDISWQYEFDTQVKVMVEGKAPNDMGFLQFVHCAFTPKPRETNRLASSIFDSLHLG